MGTARQTEDMILSELFRPRKMTVLFHLNSCDKVRYLFFPCKINNEVIEAKLFRGFVRVLCTLIQPKFDRNHDFPLDTVGRGGGVVSF